MRWASCNIFSTQDHAAAAIAKAGTPIFAWKGESEKEYWWCTDQTLKFKGGKGPNLLLDDGGDLTARIHTKYPKLLKDIKGVSEETTTGVHHPYKLMKTKKSRDQRQRQCHQISSITNTAAATPTDAIARHGHHAGRQSAVVAGFGDVGKGSAESLKGFGTRVLITESTQSVPSGAHGRARLSRWKKRSKKPIFCNRDRQQRHYHDRSYEENERYAIVCNIGHFDVDPGRCTQQV